MSDCRYGVSPVNYPDPDPEDSGQNLEFCEFINTKTIIVFGCSKWLNVILPIQMEYDKIRLLYI